jgi:hypothetical protein
MVASSLFPWRIQLLHLLENGTNVIPPGGQGHFRWAASEDGVQNHRHGENREPPRDQAFALESHVNGTSPPDGTDG